MQTSTLIPANTSNVKGGGMKKSSAKPFGGKMAKPFSGKGGSKKGK